MVSCWNLKRGWLLQRTLFDTEIRILEFLNNENVVKFYGRATVDFINLGSLPSMILENAHCDLKHFIDKKHKKIVLKDPAGWFSLAVNLTRDLVKGLSYLHEQQVRAVTL